MNGDTGTEFVFTFGAGQRLRSTSRTGGGAGGFGISLANCFVAIRAEDRDEAREIMFALFGACWAFDYAPRPGRLGPWTISARDAAGVAEYGMREVDITEALADLARERQALSPNGGPLISWSDFRKLVEHA